MNDDHTVLEARNLSKTFSSRSLLGRTTSETRAVDHVSLSLTAGKTYALVGESGSGKSTTGRLLQGLISPSAGEVTIRASNGSTSVQSISRANRDVQMIFQDPYSSLNPRRRIRGILEESLRIIGEREPAVLRSKVDEALAAVGFGEEHAQRYPHEFSGGQRQRIGIARALVVSPKIIICDEPVSALDVSIQAQILNLLRKLQAELGLAYLFITHDMTVVRYLAHRVGVMHRGKIVEEADTADLFANPQHDYTKRLLASVPIHHPSQRAEAKGKN
ncbi:ATP-binding cassette domain-containing protein [Brevibacterium sp. ZH18]|uniref:ATP-binding cassette domain-containing protein n=1 Tax=Brevibacterium sp. ZH18 TaxID=2927784 RepID=UPI001F60F1A2|nr:ATP-binding cassette domain-containing protein [Brevibacterium sp. ZH18]MCI4011117.1 ATP-binding cassette domain-containing protein [Brevibacterium sp. ZH18]